MLTIKVFTVMERLGIVIETSMPSMAPQHHGADPTLLHVSYEPYEDVADSNQLYEKITKALQYANGYTGDLRDHIEA